MREGGDEGEKGQRHMEFSLVVRLSPLTSLDRGRYSWNYDIVIHHTTGCYCATLRHNNTKCTS